MNTSIHDDVWKRLKDTNHDYYHHRHHKIKYLIVLFCHGKRLVHRPISDQTEKGLDVQWLVYIWIYVYVLVCTIHVFMWTHLHDYIDGNIWSTVARYRLNNEWRKLITVGVVDSAFVIVVFVFPLCTGAETNGTGMSSFLLIKSRFFIHTCTSRTGY